MKRKGQSHELFAGVETSHAKVLPASQSLGFWVRQSEWQQIQAQSCPTKVSSVLLSRLHQKWETPQALWRQTTFHIVGENHML